MFPALSAQLPQCAGKQEGVDRLVQGWWQFEFSLVEGHVSVLVPRRHPSGKVGHVPHQRQSADAPVLAVASEYPCGADVIRWCRETDDEGIGEEVGTFRERSTLLVDEDVRKWCRRVADTGGTGEAVEDAAHETIDRRRFMLLVGHALLVERNFPRVDACVIGLVVDQEKRQASDNGTSGFPVGRVGNKISDPAEQAGQHCLVLLDNEEPRALFRRDAEIAGNARTEITLLRTIRGVIRSYALVGVDLSHADGYKGLTVNGTCPIAEECFIETQLRLGAQIVVQTRENDDDLVAGIRSLADQPAVVAGLARLDMPDNKPPAIPRTFAERVLDQREDGVGRAVEGIDGLGRELALQPLPIPLPVSPVPLEPRCQPVLVPLVVTERGVPADPETEAADQFVRHRLPVDSVSPVGIQRQDAIDGSADQGGGHGCRVRHFEKQLLDQLDDSLLSRRRHRRVPLAAHREVPQRDPGSR